MRVEWPSRGRRPRGWGVERGGGAPASWATTAGGLALLRRVDGREPTTGVSRRTGPTEGPKEAPHAQVPLPCSALPRAGRVQSPSRRGGGLARRRGWLAGWPHGRAAGGSRSRRLARGWCVLEEAPPRPPPTSRGVETPLVTVVRCVLSPGPPAPGQRGRRVPGHATHASTVSVLPLAATLKERLIGWGRRCGFPPGVPPATHLHHSALPHTTIGWGGEGGWGTQTVGPRSPILGASLFKKKKTGVWLCHRPRGAES